MQPEAAKVTLAPEDGPAKVTEAPETGFPKLSTTMATSGLVKEAFTVADWPEPETIEIVTAVEAVMVSPWVAEVRAPETVMVGVPALVSP